MEIARVKNAGRNRPEQHENDPRDVFPVIDPHGFKIPNPKIQISNKSQNPGSKYVKRVTRRSLRWDLEFEIWDFARQCVWCVSYLRAGVHLSSKSLFCISRASPKKRCGSTRFAA